MHLQQKRNTSLQLRHAHGPLRQKHNPLSHLQGAISEIVHRNPQEKVRNPRRKNQGGRDQKVPPPAAPHPHRTVQVLPTQKHEGTNRNRQLWQPCDRQPIVFDFAPKEQLQRPTSIEK